MGSWSAWRNTIALHGEGRPKYQAPFGFVVEGHSEADGFSSLINRKLGVSNLGVPMNNPPGIGRVVRHLEEELRNLVRVRTPKVVFVTLDLREAIRDMGFRACVELIDELQTRADKWLEETRNKQDIPPLPRRIQVILVIQTFESWIIGDVQALIDLGYVKEGTEQPENVDEIANPKQWLVDHSGERRYRTNRSEVREIIAKIRPEEIHSRSRSFRKFCKEIEQAYSEWLDCLGGSES